VDASDHRLAPGEHELALDADTPPGEYLLEVELYKEQTATRLPVLDGAGRIVDERVVLQAVQVESAD
jgi:hypothetical protein